MFNIFKKKKSKYIQEWEYKLLKSIIDKLPAKYYFLQKQVNPDFILDSVPNELLGQGWKRIICDQNLFDSYRNKSINCKLIGIQVFDLEDSRNKSVEIDLYDGVIIGYKIDSISSRFDFNKIDISNLQENQYKNKSKDQLREILGDIDKDLLFQLDIESTFKIEVAGNEFYVMKDLGDGNYISIDRKGTVYGMIHDPYEIEKIFDTKEAFFDALKSGKFSIQKYYNKKMT